MTLQEQAAALAARIVGYCHANALTLDGLVAELGADEPLDAARAGRLTTYCDANALSLGGLMPEVWTMRFALINHEQEQQMRTCMANRETYDIAGIRQVIDHYETKIGVDSIGAKVARAILAERLAEFPECRPGFAFADPSDADAARRQKEEMSLILRLRSLLDMQADFKARNKLVLLTMTTKLIDYLCATHCQETTV